MNREDAREVGALFRQHFGRTPLKARLDDIFGEATELARFLDIQHLKEEAGDLLCSLLALCDECDFDPDDLVRATAEKIRRREAQYASLGRKIKVALFGGAFDPPTLGHLAVAKFVLDTSRQFDEVWFVPCYKHMHGKQMTDFKHRLDMCRILAQRDGRIKVFSYEGDNRLSGETYHFLMTLLNDPAYSESYNFSYIIGMDNANNFDRWVNYEHLENLLSFVVVPRAGEVQNPKVNWYLKSPHIFLPPDKPLVDTSSTEARRLLNVDQYNSELNGLVDAGVLEYIRQKGLYVAK